MTDFKPDFAFSFSRWKSFQACPRRYWLETIGSWGGWEPDAPERAQLLYRLSKMETLFSLGGQVTHAVIAEGLEDRQLDADGAVEVGNDQMRRGWWQSSRDLWAARPEKYQPHPAKTYTCLAEHYYPAWGAGSRFGVADARKAEAADCATLNAGPEENFERTADKSQCATCAMFEGCYGHRDQENPEVLS